MQHFVLSLAELPEVYRDPPLNPDKVSLDGIRYRCVLTAPHSSVMTTDTPRVFYPVALSVSPVKMLNIVSPFSKLCGAQLVSTALHMELRAADHNHLPIS